MQGHHGISDPGNTIVKKAIENEIDLIPIPGACAAINALIVSGLNTAQFLFIGFLSANKNERIAKLKEIKKLQSTLILYEAPHKLIRTLNDVKEILGDRYIVLAREITKIHEEYIRGKISNVINKIEEPKGEFVIIIEGNDKTEEEEKEEKLNKLTLEEHFQYYKNQGYSKKEIIKAIAKDRKVNKNEIYQYFLNK